MTSGTIQAGLDRGALEGDLRRAWAQSDALFGLVRAGGWHGRPIPLRHAPVFYLGHLPAFAWNHIGRGVLGRGPMDAAFDTRFERGIDPLSRAAADAAGAPSWPPLDDVYAYRDRVREAVIDSLDALGAKTGTDVLAENGRVVHLVVEHELMHHETLAYILHQMAPEHLARPADLPPLVLGRSAPAPERVEIPGGAVTLGAAFDEIPFGWDNEFPATRVNVGRFVLEHVPVTNERYRAFVEAGGYADAALWSPAAFAWIRRHGIESPLGWRRDGDTWRLRTMFEEVALDAARAWPVRTSHIEARAFAKWSGGRLPTEAELHRAAYGTEHGGERRHPWGAAPPSAVHGSFDFRHFAPTPVGSHPEGRSAFGILELVGNGWEWTDTHFGPFPGFSAWARTYPGYSADFFDDRHFVVFGASWATDAKLLRRSFRNWYQDRYPYVFSAFRLAYDEAA